MATSVAMQGRRVVSLFPEVWNEFSMRSPAAGKSTSIGIYLMTGSGRRDGAGLHWIGLARRKVCPCSTKIECLRRGAGYGY